MPQIAYTHSVREFIRELLKRFIPGKWIDRVISERDATFDAKLDAAFSSLDENTATKKDYCASVVSVLCEEVSGICEVTRLVCINRGHRIYADKFLTTEKFVRLVLRQDLEKLERLNAAIADRSKPLCILLHDIGIVLEDKSSGGDAAFSAAEIKKANAELKAIAADVKKTMQTGFKEVNDNIKSGVAAVGEKVDALAAKLKRGKVAVASGLIPTQHRQNNSATAANLPLRLPLPPRTLLRPRESNTTLEARCLLAVAQPHQSATSGPTPATGFPPTQTNATTANAEIQQHRRILSTTENKRLDQVL